MEETIHYRLLLIKTIDEKRERIIIQTNHCTIVHPALQSIFLNL
jgi:hypothetical protein